MSLSRCAILASITALSLFTVSLVVDEAFARSAKAKSGSMSQREIASLETKKVVQSNIQTALNSHDDKKCLNFYNKLYSKDSLKIRMIFGYKDTRPARFVGDRHERMAFVRRILRPCKGIRQDCGFVRHPDNADYFMKRVIGPSGNQIRVFLYVVHSSAASDDDANRANPFQQWQSAYSKQAFYGGIETADVVFYNGHSRFGGGPDFDPPRLNKKGEPDVKYYKSQRPGFQMVEDKLADRSMMENLDTGLHVLGLFSCASSQHFGKSITKNYDTGLISNSSLIYYADALDNSLASLSSLLEMRCQKDFKRALNYRYPVKAAKFRNLF